MRNLPRALDSLPAGAGVLVIDAESTDATATVARERGARVIVRAWNGFVDTRRFALSKVRTPWVFMLDADEALDAPARSALIALDPNPTTDGYTIARRTYFCGRPIKGGPWGDEQLVRLFRWDRAEVWPHPATGGRADLHESWTVRGAVEQLAGTIEHFSYPTLASYRRKYRRYTALEAAGLTPTSLGILVTFGRALLRIPWLFVVRGGYRDGWRGAYIAVASALYPVIALVKALRR